MKNSLFKTFILKDGTQIEVRHLVESDRKYLKRGFALLGEESRHNRFLIHKKELSEKELDYLSQIDGKKHFALVAAVHKGPGVYEGVAVIRAFKTRDQEAELAITVLDKYQGLGVGNILMCEMIQLAKDLGYLNLVGEIEVSNKKMKGLIEKFQGKVNFKTQGIMEMNLPI